VPEGRKGALFAQDHSQRCLQQFVAFSTIGMCTPASRSTHPDVLQLLGHPARTDLRSYASQIPRRARGHPYRAAAGIPIVIERHTPCRRSIRSAVFCGPDRWRIMESLGFKFPWYDPYNQNIWRRQPIDGKDHFLALNFISDTLLHTAQRADAGRSAVGLGAGPERYARPHQPDRVQYDLIASRDYYKGDTRQPPGYEFKATLALNYNRRDVDQGARCRSIRASARIATTRFSACRNCSSERSAHRRERFDFDEVPHRHPAVLDRFSAAFCSRLAARHPLLRQPRQQPLAVTTSLFPSARKDLKSGLNDVTKAPRHDDILLFKCVSPGPALGRLTSQATIVYTTTVTASSTTRTGFSNARGDRTGAPARLRTSSISATRRRAYRPHHLTASAYTRRPIRIMAVVNTSTQIRAGFLAAEARWISTGFACALSRRVYERRQETPMTTNPTASIRFRESYFFAGADTSYWVSQAIR